MEIREKAFSNSNVIGCIVLRKSVDKLQFFIQTTKRTLHIQTFSSVQSLSHVWFFAWTAACQASLSITSSQSLLKLMSIESATPSDHLILCRPLLLLPSIFPSIRVFSNELALFQIRWPKYWSFSFSISTSNEYSGLISFRIDWFGLLAVQGSPKSLLQHCPSPTPRACSNSPFIDMVMLSNHLILCCPLLLPPSIFPSIRVFSNESALHIRWPKTGVSASTSVLLMNIHDWSPLGLTT